MASKMPKPSSDCSYRPWANHLFSGVAILYSLMGRYTWCVARVPKIQCRGQPQEWLGDKSGLRGILSFQHESVPSNDYFTRHE